MGIEGNNRENVQTGATNKGAKDTNSGTHKCQPFRPQKPFKPKVNSFKGETFEMHGYVFQKLAELGNRRQFTKTLEALDRYINKKLKFTGDMRSLYQRCESPKLTDPGDICEEDAQKPITLLL